MFIFIFFFFFFFSSRRRHTRFSRDWSSDVCSSDLDNSATAENVKDAILVQSKGFSRDSLLKYYPWIVIVDRKSVVKGKSVDLGGRRIIKKKKNKKIIR